MVHKYGIQVPADSSTQIDNQQHELSDQCEWHEVVRVELEAMNEDRAVQMLVSR